MVDSAIVETHGLTKRYGAVMSLCDCTLAVRRGEVFGLLGPNGAGKTTLLRVLMGYLRPSAGSAAIDHLDCYQRSLEVRQRVAYLPGEARLFRQMRGYEVLRFFSRVRSDNGFVRSRELADRLGLDLSRRVSAMSTGMRQKLALSAVLAVDAPLLILDEPTSNLDPTVRSEVIALVSEARGAGRTVIFSSHVLSEVERVCDRVALLRRGELVHLQPMGELRRRHRIRAKLAGELPPLPSQLAAQLNVQFGGQGEVILETDGELAPLFGWLAHAPLTEVRIEPVGLSAIYEKFHSSAGTQDLLEE